MMTKPYYHHHTSRVDSPPGGTSVFSSRGDDRKLLKYPKRSWVSCPSSPNAHSSQVLVVLCSVDIHYSTDITSQGAKNDHLTTLQDLGLRPCQDETVLHATFFCLCQEKKHCNFFSRFQTCLSVFTVNTSSITAT